MHLRLCQPVRRQMCVCLILANSNSFVTVKNGGLVYGASKAKYRKRMWGIIDTSKNKDGEYIRVQFHLASPSLCLASLFRWRRPRFTWWERTLALNASQVLLNSTHKADAQVLHIIVCIHGCILWCKFGRGWPLFLCIISVLYIVFRQCGITICPISKW